VLELTGIRARIPAESFPPNAGLGASTPAAFQRRPELSGVGPLVALEDGLGILPAAKLAESVAFRRQLSRGKLLSFLASQPRCTVAMEACGSAHYWGREITSLGHEVRLVPPIYVKPFVKRQKNDAADAEAITEAAQRPTMHLVAVKTEAQQALGMFFRTRDLLLRQRTQTINALRVHLAEYGVVAPQGRTRIGATEPANRLGLDFLQPQEPLKPLGTVRGMFPQPRSPVVDVDKVDTIAPPEVTKLS